MARRSQNKNDDPLLHTACVVTVRLLIIAGNLFLNINPISFYGAIFVGSVL